MRLRALGLLSLFIVTIIRIVINLITKYYVVDGSGLDHGSPYLALQLAWKINNAQTRTNIILHCGEWQIQLGSKRIGYQFHCRHLCNNLMEFIDSWMKVVNYVEILVGETISKVLGALSCLELSSSLSNLRRPSEARQACTF